MKRINLLLFALLTSWAIQAQNKMSFNETTHDFGIIEEKGGKVSFDFIVTNEGDEPLVISEVKASCGCTTPSWTRSPIEPGKTGKVTAIYNPQGRPGRFNKSISVNTNFSPAPMTLYIKGEVQKQDAKPEDAYPVKNGQLLFKKAPELDFGTVTPTGTKKMTIELYNPAETAFTPSTAGLPAWITLTGSVPAKSGGTLECTLNAAEVKKYGKTESAFSMDGDLKNLIPYSVTVQDNFDNLTNDERKNAGKIQVNNQALTFNSHAKNQMQILKIANSGKSVLNIKAIQSSVPNLTFSKTALTVKPKEIVEVKVSYLANKQPVVDESIIVSIFSDDPKNPQKDVKVVINP